MLTGHTLDFWCFIADPSTLRLNHSSSSRRPVDHVNWGSGSAAKDPLARYGGNSLDCVSGHVQVQQGLTIDISWRCRWRGIRGKSSLLILENIMERVRTLEGLEEVPRPCEYFDLIGGPSTGGRVRFVSLVVEPLPAMPAMLPHANTHERRIATMLGRRGMTVSECIKADEKVGQAASTPKRRVIPLPGPPQGAFSATALEKAIKQTVRGNCPDQWYPTCGNDSFLRQRREPACTAELLPAFQSAIGDEQGP